MLALLVQILLLILLATIVGFSIKPMRRFMESKD